jgi:predicted O-methyltransferase YrrM
MEPNFRALQEYYKNQNIKLIFIKGSTLDTLEPFLRDYDDFFDFIEVDGSHAFEIAHSDILNTYNKIRKGGVLYIDDYTPTEVESAVVKAVDEVDWSGYDVKNGDDIFWGIKK